MPQKVAGRQNLLTENLTEQGIRKAEARQDMLGRQVRQRAVSSQELHQRRKRNIIVEAEKTHAMQVNVFVYSFTVVFTCILLGYALMVTYNNWVETSRVVDCNQ